MANIRAVPIPSAVRAASNRIKRERGLSAPYKVKGFSKVGYGRTITPNSAHVELIETDESKWLNDKLFELYLELKDKFKKNNLAGLVDAIVAKFDLLYKKDPRNGA